MLELREDITEKEFETIKFYLDGKVKKKKLQEIKDLLDLFIFLEQEGLISHNQEDSLITVLKAIKRVDLIEQVQKYFGKIISLTKLCKTFLIPKVELLWYSQSNNTVTTVFCVFHAHCITYMPATI